MNGDNVTYLDNFGVDHTQKEIIKFIENRNFITNIYRVQAYDSIISRYFCIGLINVLKVKSWLEYTNIFSPNEYKKNNKIILKYFQ